MIVVKTKMKQIPESCRKCSFKQVLNNNCMAYCAITGRDCPAEKKPSGNVGYGMPSWCPLMDIELIDDEGD